MRRQLFIVLMLSLASLTAEAQNLNRYKEKLQSSDPTYGSRVSVTEHGTAATAVRSMQNRSLPNELWGYRVRIFFDNSQNARTLANQAMTRFKEIYPDIPAYIVYDNPYFKVTVGNCLTEDEARILQGRIQGAFDRAFPIQEKIPMSLIGEQAASSEAKPETVSE